MNGTGPLHRRGTTPGTSNWQANPRVCRGTEPTISPEYSNDGLSPCVRRCSVENRDAKAGSPSLASAISFRARGPRLLPEYTSCAGLWDSTAGCPMCKFSMFSGTVPTNADLEASGSGRRCNLMNEQTRAVRSGAIGTFLVLLSLMAVMACGSDPEPTSVPTLPPSPSATLTQSPTPAAPHTPSPCATLVLKSGINEIEAMEGFAS